MAYKKAFLDTNILLDYVIDRGDASICAEEIFELCVEGKIEFYVAAHSLLNMFYILRKYISVDNRKLILHNICELCRVVEIDKDKIIKAVTGDEADVEDHVQVLCAEECGAECIVTRDIKGLQSGSLETLTPSQFLLKVNAQ